MIDFNEKKYQRLISIYGLSKMKALSNSKVAVLGLGGVGSFCSTALARSGIGNLVLVDFDTIEESNINRQEFANINTIGKYKVDVAQNYLLCINQNIKINKFNKKITANNIEKICSNVDFIIDAIDDVAAKLCIAQFAQTNNIPLISCMGTALRRDATKLGFSDIYHTSICPLCKKLRKMSKDLGLNAYDVLYSTELPTKTIDKKLGSTSYLPPIAGLMLAGWVIEKIGN